MCYNKLFAIIVKVQWTPHPSLINTAEAAVLYISGFRIMARLYENKETRFYIVENVRHCARTSDGLTNFGKLSVIV